MMKATDLQNETDLKVPLVHHRMFGDTLGIFFKRLEIPHGMCENPSTKAPHKLVEHLKTPLERKDDPETKKNLE